MLREGHQLVELAFLPEFGVKVLAASGGSLPFRTFGETPGEGRQEELQATRAETQTVRLVEAGEQPLLFRQLEMVIGKLTRSFHLVLDPRRVHGDDSPGGGASR